LAVERSFSISLDATAICRPMAIVFFLASSSSSCLSS
jgi:hypothetical protein